MLWLLLSITAPPQRRAPCCPNIPSDLPCPLLLGEIASFLLLFLFFLLAIYRLLRVFMFYVDVHVLYGFISFMEMYMFCF